MIKLPPSKNIALCNKRCKLDQAIQHHPMKQVVTFVFTTVCVILVINTHAIGQQYGEWQTVYFEGEPPNRLRVQISFSMPGCNSTSNVRYRINNEFSRLGGKLYFKIDYTDCNEKPGLVPVYIDLDKPGIREDPGWWFRGMRVNHVIVVDTPKDTRPGEQPRQDNSKPRNNDQHDAINFDEEQTQAQDSIRKQQEEEAGKQKELERNKLDKQANQYLENAENASSGAVNQSLNLQQAQIVNTYEQQKGIGNQQQLQQQQTQINQQQYQLLATQIGQLGSFLNARYSNQNIKWDGNTSTLSQNELLYGSARQREFYKSGAEEEENKKIREQLYESIRYYSGWYLDSVISISTAKSAISWTTGEPDLIQYYPQNIKSPIRKLLENGNGVELARLLKPVVKSPTDGKRIFDFLYPITDGKHEKAVEREQRKADNGDLEAILNIFNYYATHRQGDGDMKKLDGYFNKFMAHKEIQNGSIQESSILANWVVLRYCQVHFPQADKEGLLKLSGLVSKCETMISLRGFENEYLMKLRGRKPTIIFNERFKRYYTGEQFYDNYFLIKSSEVCLYMRLYELSTSEEEKNEYNNKIITAYYNVATELRPIFDNRILKRPYTRDPQWNEHNGH
jgi:hypothetical protein